MVNFRLTTTGERPQLRGCLAQSLSDPSPPRLPLVQRIREAIFGSPKPIDPSAAYPEIVIAEKDEKSALEV